MAVKIGIIGAGGMTNYHIPGFKAEGAVVASITDINAKAAQIVAERHGIATVHTDVKELLRSDIDAVSIITPNKFHAPLTLQALAAGKHVFCEKPPALNAAEMKKWPPPPPKPKNC